MNMTAAKEATLLAGVSVRAQKLYRRINNDGRFYDAYPAAGQEVKAMQELIDARLIQVGGRVARIVSCYVPVRGFKPCVLESWRGQQ